MNFGAVDTSVSDLIAAFDGGSNASAGIPGGIPVSEIEVLPEYETVRQLVEEKVPAVVVTGGAGTGKSTLIQWVSAMYRGKIAVVAPTGIAAVNVAGTTIHSFFRFPPAILDPTRVRASHDRGLFERLELLVLDEISMVRPDIVDSVDSFLREARRNSRPFGGVTVLFVGDLFQLPPVVVADDEQALRTMNYRSNWFFSSRALAEVAAPTVELTRTFRQRDENFVSILNDLRRGENVHESLKVLNERYVPREEGANEITLTSTNAVAERRNQICLAALPGPERVYRGVTEGSFPATGKRLPAPMELQLRCGAQVMFTKNDHQRQIVNGTLGVVREMSKDSCLVDVVDGDAAGRTLQVFPETWSRYRYKLDRKRGTIERKVAGSYTQIPLAAAWAVTIHKAQGKTLGRVLVDLGAGAFACGQVYVAMSRVRRLTDLRLASRVRPSDIRCDAAATEFYRLVSARKQRCW